MNKSTRPAIPKGGNDCIMTPDSLALAIVGHFSPSGILLDPCAGTGAFENALAKFSFSTHGIDLCRGQDFMDWNEKVDWIITNPPWSKIGSKKATKNKPKKIGFLEKAMQVSDNVVFLCYANAWFVRSRINAMKAAGFHFREFVYVKQPKKPWPQMGLQLAAVWISKTPGNCVHGDLNWEP